jgi:YD repeat-containing protein
MERIAPTSTTARGVTETDERGNSTAYIYRAYGAPDKDKVLAQITAPNNIITVLLYDPLNHLMRIHQGEKNPSDGLIHGYSRTFVYDTRFYLTSVDDPETGVTSYGRDALGNMISRQTGSSGVTHYVYDARNRQILADYPGTTPDVETSYDAERPHHSHVERRERHRLSLRRERQSREPDAEDWGHRLSIGF